MPDGGAGRMASNDARNQSGGAERVTLSGAESGTAPHAHASVRGLGFMAIRWQRARRAAQPQRRHLRIRGRLRDGRSGERERGGVT
jgi:hypothetical protein